MGNFELLDNLFQIAVLLCACCAAGFFALRHKSRSLLILSLAYACFAMGTTYYVLYLVIMGIWPQVFYVAEISWLAAWLFYLSAQIERTRGGQGRLFVPGGARGGRPRRDSIPRPRFRPVPSAVCAVRPHGGRDGLSLGLSYADRRTAPAAGTR